MECWIEIRLKNGLHDPQGRALYEVAKRLGCEYLTGIHMGRLVILTFPQGDQARAEEEVQKLLEQILVNPLIEDYTLQWRS